MLVVFWASTVEMGTADGTMVRMGAYILTEVQLDAVY